MVGCIQTKWHNKMYTTTTQHTTTQHATTTRHTTLQNHTTTTNLASGLSALPPPCPSPSPPLPSPFPPPPPAPPPPPGVPLPPCPASAKSRLDARTRCCAGCARCPVDTTYSSRTWVLDRWCRVGMPPLPPPPCCRGCFATPPAPRGVPRADPALDRGDMRGVLRADDLCSPDSGAVLPTLVLLCEVWAAAGSIKMPYDDAGGGCMLTRRLGCEHSCNANLLVLLLCNTVCIANGLHDTTCC